MSSEMKNSEVKQNVSLCCRSACPTAEIDMEKFTVTINDDYGGSVLLTLEELELLTASVLEKMSSPLQSPLGAK